MSVLSTPRITFSGQVSWDPIVTNNYKTSYDETTGDILPSDDPAEAFRAAALQQVPAGNWNPHGTHRSNFFETFITGVDLGAGAQANDPLIGSPVNFSGMLVDLEPYGSTSSQLFFDQMSFGIQGGCCIAAKRAYRFTDRYINFARNNANNMIAGVAGITWQTCFPKENLDLAAHSSPVLEAFISALGRPEIRGLMVRWQAYRTVYFDDPTLTNGSSADRKLELLGKLTTGGWQPNPARSLLVGSVGLWHADGSIHEPGDRTLVPQGVTLQDGTAFGPAFASLGSDSLTLDLGTFVPDKDRDTNKHDVGTLSVLAVDPKDDTTVLATLAAIPYTPLSTLHPYLGYNKECYEATAGVVTISGISDEAIRIAQTADLQIRDGNGTILATESALRAIPEDPNLYLDEGSTTPSRVRVYNRGVPVGKGVSLQVSTTVQKGVDAQGDPILAQELVLQSTTDENGYVSLQFAVQKPGVIEYDFSFPPAPLPDPNYPYNTTTITFMTVRVLPTDANIAAYTPNWDNVYKYVLSNWYAMAPCMDNWLMLNDADMVKRYGPLVKKLTAADNFESFRYMPVTRDLSIGKRALLYAYLDGLQSAPQAVLADSAAPSAAENVILVNPANHARPRRMPSKSMPA